LGGAGRLTAIALGGVINSIVAGGLDDIRVRALIEHHLGESRVSACNHALKVEELKAPSIQFWAAWDGERLLGIGALQRLSHDHGEIKSMHTASDTRRRGIANAMLLHIIDAACAAGMRRLSLETGSWDYFAPARALYEKHGFVVCGPFGAYPLDPSSVFMTRAL
jgi:putative acetyltransferase